ETGDGTKVNLGHVLLRWNGAGFDELPTPPDAFRQLFVLGPDEIAGTTRTDLWQLDATGWHDLAAPAGVFPADWNVASSEDIWMSGSRQTGGIPPDGETAVVAHWDGTTWTVMDAAPDPSTGSQATSIADLGAGRVAVMVQNTGSSQSSEGEIRVWDGAIWASVPLPPAAAHAGELAGTSPNDIWLSNWAALSHWDGRRWQMLGPIGGRPIAWPGGQAWLPGSAGLSFGHRVIAQPSFLNPLDPTTDTVDMALARGDSLWWHAGPAGLSTADSSGVMQLDMLPDSVSRTTFSDAGTFELATPAGLDRVSVSPDITPSVIDPDGAASLRWADAASPERSADVQVERPGTTRFVPWRASTHTAYARFAPDAGPGIYRFRVRVHAPDQPPAGWSPIVALRVRLRATAQPNWTAAAGSLPPAFTTTVTVTGRRGSTWIGGTGGTDPLFRVDETGLVTAMRFSPATPRSISSIAARGSQLWVAANDGVYRRVGGIMQRFGASLCPCGDGRIAVADDGQAWLTSLSAPHVVHWDGQAWHALDLGEPITSVAVDPQGGVWAAGHTLHRLTAHGWIALPPPPFNLSPVVGLLPFSGRSVWVLNLYGQYARWNGSHWRSGPQGLERQLAGSSPQDVWSAGFSGRAAHWDGRIWKDLEVPWTARTLAVGPSGRVVAVGCCKTTNTQLKSTLTPLAVGDRGFSKPMAWVRAGALTLLHVAAGAGRAHTVTEQSGLAQIDPGSRLAGATFTASFPAAGRYRLVDSSDGGVCLVEVPIARTADGLRLAAGQPAAGRVIDVQKQPPGAVAFTPWITGSSSPTAQLPTTSGTYLFRARLRSSDGASRTGWSPVLTVTIP
ncbi:MAG: hypothetical protein QOE17_14, partial [Gaiellales bacterium]|nr:hypothetical protein [Gaiellales bacterium]